MPPGLNPQCVNTSSARPHPPCGRAGRLAHRPSRESSSTRCARAAPFRTRNGTRSRAIALATSATTRALTAAACACCVRLALRRSRRSAGSKTGPLDVREHERLHAVLFSSDGEFVDDGTFDSSDDSCWSPRRSRRLRTQRQEPERAVRQRRHLPRDRHINRSRGLDPLLMHDIRRAGRSERRAAPAAPAAAPCPPPPPPPPK